MSPELPTDEDIDRERLVAFLKKKGSIELLIVVSEGGARYSEIVEETSIADSTVDKRRAEAVDLNLIGTDSKPGEDGMERFYVLKPLGQVVRLDVHRAGLDKVFWQLQALREQYSERSETVISTFEDETTDLESARNRMLKYEDFDQIGSNESRWDWL
ncbi:hypothetical protein HLRTI_000427 [Halorhabdus tiamatea SARL4B]|uniref:Uncharacterized protein n=1 Tax=Halorhabdus tiamatea SARL4B TaxID=1033806 RepID=F7PMG8_9EURY|nr:hypothetical protein [Halorhabdus tiamatea]ERJ07385.1 hypothetical protein HLRTI_000427 [Halorhabdus tiamatea SARL4B]